MSYSTCENTLWQNWMVYKIVFLNSIHFQTAIIFPSIIDYQFCYTDIQNTLVTGLKERHNKKQFV